MTITSDWHIHSGNSCDGACMSVGDLISGAQEKGILDYGLSDHIHTPYNLPDLARSREEFLASNPSPRFHFGVEVSCVSQWELDEIRKGGHDKPTYGLRSGGPPWCEFAIGIGEAELREYEVEYVVAGTHWPLYVPLEREAVIRDYHRQNMFLAMHPLVDIVAHPWWWMGHWKDAAGNYPAEPWFDDFGHIPATMHEEFARACVEHETQVEINLSAMLLNPHYPEGFAWQYLDYLAELKERGAGICIGSDCHSERFTIDFERAAAMLDRVGIRDEDLWRLPPREAAT